MAGMEDDMKDNFFNPYLCYVCKNEESFSRSKVCSACKLISYCSSEHQKADWGNHKIFCKAVQKVCRDLRQDDVFDVPLYIDLHSKAMQGMAREIRLLIWNNVQTNVIALIAENLQRKMKRFELSMIYLSKHCAFCFTRKNVEKESVCTDCFGAAYCSKEHQRLDNHKKVCADFREVLNMDLFMLNVNLESPGIELLRPNQASELKLDAFDMKSFIAKYVRPGSKLEEEALISFYYTSVLTFAYSISRIHNFKMGKRLTIHVVGAQTSWEGLVLEHWENLLHLFPSVHVATVIHIGPNIDGPRIKLRLCNDCTNANRCVKILFYKQSYHEYHYSSCVMKPDVIIGFNCGLYGSALDFDPWRPSLPLFFKYDNVPVILTEMALWEAQDDLERLLKKDVIGDKNVRVVVECEKNPFKNLRLWREWQDSDRIIRTKNSYVSVLIVESG